MLEKLALSVPGSGELQAPGVVPQGGLQDGGAGATALANGLTIFLIAAAVLCLFFLLFGGIKWIMSDGDKSKIDSARKTIIFAIVGLLLAFLSFFIINVVGGLFGVEKLVE